MVVARKSRKQTNQRTLETSGAREVNSRDFEEADMLVGGSVRREDEHTIPGAAKKVKVDWQGLHPA